MADIHCPMCGESNPPELEVCQHCQARLKPLVPEDSDFSLDLPEEEVPDWLSDLRDDEDPIIPAQSGEESLDWMASTDAASPLDSSQSSDLPQDDPEWLSNLRSAEPNIQAPQPAFEAPQTISDDDEEDPAWLDEIRQRQGQEDNSSDAAEPAEDSGDYMERIQTMQSNENAAAAEAEQQPEGDLLASFSSGDQSQEPAKDTSRDWLSGLSDDAQNLFQESTPAAEESPDWLADLTASTAEAKQESTPSDEESPDWLADLPNIPPETIQEPAQPVEESPDFLAELEDSPSETVQEPVQPAEESPDWLAELGDSSSESVQEPAQPAEESPDFLAELEDSSSETIQEPAPSDEESPDWLAELEDSSSETIQEPAPSDEESPDWLPKSESDAEKTVLGQVIAPSESIDALLDDHAKAFEDAAAEPPDEPKKPSFIDTGSLPTWLVDLKRSEPSIPSEALQTPALVTKEEADPFSFQSEDTEPELTPAELPSWLSDGTLNTEEQDDLIYDSEEPDELSFEAEEPETSPEASLEISPEISRGIAPEIAPADLPNWVETMRPEVPEISATDEDAQTGDEETVGPLSGLRGVLPAEPEIVQFTKPPLYSIKLDVTENQNINAALFDELIASESETIISKRQSEALYLRILRLAIASLLFLSVLVPVITGSTSIAVPSPANIPPETQQFFSLVNNFTSEIRVLIAFDYQPGMSGEMNTAAAAVIDHLLLKGAQIATISTNPTGAALAANSLAATQPTHEYINQKLYRNLGFIAGGTSALRNLAENPRKAVPINILEGEELRNVWDLAPLQNIQTLNDFNLITVITDDPNTARAWVEQVQPTLDGTPLTMVISAQAEPLVRPYFETSPKQVDGIVTGILGAASYEILSGRPNLARTHWNAFSMGLSISIILVLTGGFASLAISLLSKRQPKRSETQK